MLENEEILKYKLKPISYKKINSCIVVKDKNKQLVFKKKQTDKEKLFNYLKSRNFESIPNYYKDDKYEVSEYIETIDLNDEQKIEDLIYVLSNLHFKTTTYKSVNIDEIKEIYEKYNNKISSLTNYYKELNNIIDEEIFMSPSSYLLIRNITKLYNVLNYCKQSLDDWYSAMIKEKKIRIVQLHNNLDLSHFLEGEKKVLISWDKTKKDIPIYDLYELYKKYFNKFDFQNLFSIYESRYPLQKYEKQLFFILISIPEKIEFINDEYINTLNVTNLYTYISKSEEIISPYYSENEEK